MLILDRGLVRGALLAAVAASLFAPFGVASANPQTPGTPLQSVAKLRYPVALALVERDRILLTANQRSGTVSIVDLTGRRVVAEVPVGKSLSAIAALAPGNDGHFLATDWTTHQLQLLSHGGSELKMVDSVSVSPYPASVVSDKNGRRCFVASLWSRRLTFVDLDRDARKSIRLRTAATIRLPFAPRLQTLCPDGRILVVADAFGGNLALVNVSQAKIEIVRSIPGHNIRGLAWSSDGRRLFVSHQTLNPLAYSSPDDLHWGSVVSNVVRSLDLDALERPETDVLAGSELFPLGDVGNGAGDPASLAVTKDGTVYVALAGVGEVAATPADMAALHRLRVGIRPTALAASADGVEVYVADMFGDAITTIQASDFRSASGEKGLIRISLGPQPSLSAVNRGERLFFDAHLSHDNWMSCHSCHTDGQSSDGLADTLGDGSFGAPKRIPSLGGVAQTGPWAWKGSVRDLAEQVRKSFQTTMHAKLVTDEQVRDLTEYLKSLEPAPPIDRLPDPDGRSAVDRGRGVFSRRGCDGCHVPPTYTSSRTYDVGLRDEMGNRKFNPPSLRGVGQRAALFHDGRAASLKAVFAVYRHPGNTDLPASELADLLAFLRSL